MRIKVTYQMDQVSLTALEKERQKRLAAGVPRMQATVSQILNEMVVPAKCDASHRDCPADAECQKAYKLSPSGPPAGALMHKRGGSARQGTQVAALPITEAQAALERRTGSMVRRDVRDRTGPPKFVTAGLPPGEGLVFRPIPKPGKKR